MGGAEEISRAAKIWTLPKQLFISSTAINLSTRALSPLDQSSHICLFFLTILNIFFYTFLSFTVAFLFFPVNPEFYPDLSLFSFLSFNLSSPSNTKCYCALKCHLTAGVIPRLCVLGGDAGLTCGGYLTMEVYHTGLTHPPPSKLGRQERLSISFSSSFCPRSI